MENCAKSLMRPRSIKYASTTVHIAGSYVSPVERVETNWNYAGVSERGETRGKEKKRKYLPLYNYILYRYGPIIFWNMNTRCPYNVVCVRIYVCIDRERGQDKFCYKSNVCSERKTENAGRYIHICMYLYILCTYV